MPWSWGTRSGTPTARANSSGRRTHRSGDPNTRPSSYRIASAHAQQTYRSEPSSVRYCSFGADVSSASPGALVAWETAHHRSDGAEHERAVPALRRGAATMDGEALQQTAQQCALNLPGTTLYSFEVGWEACRVRHKWFLLLTEVPQHTRVSD